MQYFFRKNSTEKDKYINKSYIFKISSTTQINHEILTKISSIIDAKLLNHIFEPGFNYAAVFYRSGVNSPWSSKTKDILDSCIDFSSYEIERFSLFKINKKYKKKILPDYDPMIEILISSKSMINKYFDLNEKTIKKNFKYIPIKQLSLANKKMGLAMSHPEILYLEKIYKNLKRNPTDVELMMFSQINSEHCRHKIFNSTFYIDNKKMNKTLFQMIKHTNTNNNKDIVSAYSDNSSIIKGKIFNELTINNKRKYQIKKSPENYIIKAETHNHPTAISPYAGAATGSGGEIRDEGATGRGSTPKVGFCGYTLSNLNIPNHLKIWEKHSFKYPTRIKNSFEIIIEAPIGAARYNNEFGRPNIFGYFRTYEQKRIDQSKDSVYGYHKPIMIAGGIGYINNKYTHKNKLKDGDVIAILGGPSFRIGIGGGAASSMQSGTSDIDLDYASVQRDNAEIERRCQEVINTCTYKKNNPIVSIHDIGAGGLCNAVPEIVNDSKMGARVYLDDVDIAESNMSSLEIWCNESQERYVLIISKENLDEYKNICIRENCPTYIIGNVTAKKHLKVSHQNDTPIDLPMKFLLGKPPIVPIEIKKSKDIKYNNDFSYPSIKESIKHVLQLPCVSDKGFLITIGDRSVTGLVARDQLIGPEQVPVSNIAITKSDINSNYGQVLTVGEKPNVAALEAEASIDMAFGEVITNIASAYIKDIKRIRLSANWMANSSDKNELSQLYQSVKRLSSLCRQSEMIIPVGKDSLSMSTKWKEKKQKEVKSPVSLVLSAFASIDNINTYVTPRTELNSDLYLIDLGDNHNRMGGSALDQVCNITQNEPPRINNLESVINYFKCTQELLKNDLLNAYHDKSDGGLITTIIEMGFASNMSIKLKKCNLKSNDAIKYLFNEELGGVYAVSRSDKKQFLNIVKKYKLDQFIYNIGIIKKEDNPLLDISEYNYVESLCNLRKSWSELSHLIQSNRDNKKTALQEYKSKIQSHQNVSKYIHSKLSFKLKDVNKKYLNIKSKPKIAIFREQGVNGHKEMANAFKYVGFDAYDVNTNDIINNPEILNDYSGLVACGGFSYGDVLGAGRGWANKIIHNQDAYKTLSKFFKAKDKFTLGVCNGCQMLSNLKEIIPGSAHWPDFVRNNSNQFEARQVLVKIPKSNSILFNDMHNSIIPIIVSHGEGKISITNSKNLKKITMSYVDNYGNKTKDYPFNPNGSIDGATGFCNIDGRINIMMPHPERLLHINNFSWAPSDWKISPWLKLFINAREWVDHV
jgi:phosphoribosylformylglycinamidine synthase